MPDIEYIRAEIERMRLQVHRQRGEIKQLQRAGIPTGLGRSPAGSNARHHRPAVRSARPAQERAARSDQRKSLGRAELVMREPLKWFDDNVDNPPWIKALAEVRRLAPREGWRYQHVQAIIVAIDQYAEAALGNR